MRQVYQYPVSKNNAVTAPVDLSKILSVPVQTFMIYADTDTILYGIAGTVLFIHPACLFSNGDSLTTGKIKLELKELYTKEALLKERAYTISNGSMLESDGSVYIHASTENGKQLEIDCENAVRICLPREVQPKMLFFEGNRNVQGNMNWEMSESITPVYQENRYDLVAEKEMPGEISKTEAALNTYFFSIKKFGWINCDRFYEDSREKTDLHVTFTLPVSEKNFPEVYNYIVFDSLMSIIPLEYASGQWICPNLPIGVAVTCISIQKSGTRLYYGSKKIQIGDWESSVILLKEINGQDLLNLLQLSL